MPDAQVLYVILFLTSPLWLWLFMRLGEIVFDYFRQPKGLPDDFDIDRWAKGAVQKLKDKADAKNRKGLIYRETEEYRQIEAKLKDAARAWYEYDQQNGDLQKFIRHKAQIDKQLRGSMFRRIGEHLQHVNAFYVLAVLIAGIFIYAPYQWDIEADENRRIQTIAKQSYSPDSALRRVNSEMSRYPYQQRQFIWGAHFRQETIGTTQVTATRKLITSQFALEIGLACIAGFVCWAIQRSMKAKRNP